jgi:hypothetical protein
MTKIAIDKAWTPTLTRLPEAHWDGVKHFAKDFLNGLVPRNAGR